MILTAVKIFDRDLNSKGRDLPAVKMIPKRKDPTSKERSPRPDQRTHLIEEAKGAKEINAKEKDPKTILKRSSVVKIALPNHSQDVTEDRDMVQRDQSINDLDAWIAELNQGKEDWETEFGSESAANWHPIKP